MRCGGSATRRNCSTFSYLIDNTLTLYKMDVQSRSTHFPLVLAEYSQTKTLKERSEKLKRVSSYHMFPIDKVEFRKYPVVLYQKSSARTLQDIIDEKLELLPSQIKSLVWQITKLMLACHEVGICHLRLYPKAIVLCDWQLGRPFFVQIKDFSLGKEFQEVKEGKILEYFKYLHPDLSVLNKHPIFSQNQQKYDIWSLGVILYELIYSRSPFCKEGKDDFSKTVLRNYLSKEYQVPYLKTKYNSINSFIGKCLELDKSGWNSWLEIKKFIVNEEEIYNELDFMDGRFEELAGLHLRLIALLSGIYCMIIDECNNCPHSFWHRPISFSNPLPFQLKIAQFTLKLIKVMEQHFQRIYFTHLCLLKADMREQMTDIGQQIENQLAHRGEEWIQKSFGDVPLNLQVISHIQQVCMQVKLEMSEFGKSQLEHKLWRSMQTLNAYCNEVILIFNRCKTRMKHVFEQFYLSPVLESLALNDFQYQNSTKVSVSSIIKRFRKE